ncbi:hypothetical protein BWQ96_10107 [Gracilariopsis chorda]|uniref:Uncharacterized protein n=1 Tax=Gracilariopsis chorda TaxID=448386 RepID=A0A2V3IDN6_9FLOR|nr:hypothetical protein BWQ96_10107 [Gracilariopsis chorda]|eukprot:PXF40184.1 hypothetical protein BWQ96_10107 [Gracilariopsis chorda]
MKNEKTSAKSDEKERRWDAGIAQNESDTTIHVTLSQDHELHGVFASFWSNLAEKVKVKIDNGSPEGRQMAKVEKDHLARILIVEAR